MSSMARASAPSRCHPGPRVSGRRCEMTLCAGIYCLVSHLAPMGLLPDVTMGDRLVWRSADLSVDRSVDLAFESLPIWSPQLKLLKLSGGGTRELVAELHLFRTLVTGQKRPAVDQDVLFGNGDAVVGHHQGSDHFTPCVVRDPDDRHLCHASQREDGIFDFDGGDILPSGDDEVLLAVENLEVAFVIQKPAVPGMKPPIGHGSLGSFWLLPVPLHDGVATGQYLAIGTDRELGPEGRRTGPRQFPGPFAR